MCERFTILQLDQATKTTNNRHNRGERRLKAVSLQMLLGTCWMTVQLAAIDCI